MTMAMQADRYACPSCGNLAMVPFLARQHCEPTGYDGYGAPIYRWSEPTGQG
jgi:hypothetical protein